MQDKKSIPRFASFKPPTAPDPDQHAERQSRESSRRDEPTRRSRHRSHRDRSRSSDRRREHRGHRYSRKDEVQHEAVALPDRTESKTQRAPEDDPDLFFVDRKGDRHNITYGTLHRYSVPAFYRIGRGSVLGLPRMYKIDRSTAFDGKLVLRTDPQNAGPKPKSAFSKLNKQRPKLLRVRPEYISDAAVDTAADFLPLTPSKSRRSIKPPGDFDTDDERYAYRSIQGKAKPQDDIPSDLESAPDTDSSDDERRQVELGDEVKQKNVELSRNVESNPYDVVAWLKLIDHQDAVLRGDENETRPLTYAEKTSLADIKTSLCEKALKRIGENASKDRLLLKLLEEGAKLWDTKKLSSQWQNILKANSRFISLWVRYLDFRQTQFLDFTYERCMRTFIDCLRLNMSSPDGPEKVNVQLYLFLRLTLFIRESGFTEHAVGLWQTALESTFFRPDGLNAGDGGVLSAFREFWETEVARVGDVGAKGWKSGSNPPLEPKVSAFESQLTPPSIFPSWTTCERERIMESQTPARSLDESNDDDPYRVVISSDFEDFLPLVWGASSADALINSFLYFCHLPPLTSPTNIEASGRWAGDNFLRNEFMSTSATLDSWLPTSDHNERSEPSAISFPQHNFIHTLDTFFAQHSWFDSFQQWTEYTSAGQSELDPGWVRRSLRLLVEASPENDDLAEYALALESAANIKEAKKYAKSLLKKRPSSLRLYNAYALIECGSGNHSAADHVWATSISMSKTFAEDDRLEVILLWRTWIWESLKARDLARASYLLVSMPQNSIDLASLPSAAAQVTFSPTELLKIRSFLSDSGERALAAQKPIVFVACVDILAIFLYASNSKDLVSGLDAYATSMNRLLKTLATETFKSFTRQLLHQAQARLIYYHVRTSNLYKPSQVRAILKESISAFPYNTIFLSLFAWNESRFRIEERVREVTKDITTTRSTLQSVATTQVVPITSYLFSIYTELNRPVYAGSTLHSVRAAFEKAIGDSNPRSNTATTDGSAARSNLSIWKLYILFELSHKEMQRAKSVFYRGMRACPWSKELIMLAFTHLMADLYEDPAMKRYGMGFDELHRVYNVLVEKELRVHVDIENLLEEIAAKRAQHAATTSSGMPIHMPDDAGSGEEL